MAYPPPSGSVSRSETSREKMRASADAMLRSSLSGGVPPPSGPASVSRPTTSRTVVPSTADGKPRSASSGAVPPAAPSASVSRSTATKDVKSPADEMLRLSLASARGIPTSSSSVSIARGIPAPSATVVTAPPPAYSSKVSGRPVDSVELLKRRLKSEDESANAAVPRRSKAGMFKAACSTDLLFLMDTTSSMTPYIETARDQVKSIVAEIKKEFLNESQVRVAVVSYKDHADIPNIEFLDFTTSVDEVYRFLDRLTARGGADPPEDVLGGIQQALNASWKQQIRCLIHIADAPAHGSSLHDMGASHDNYHEPGSEPHGLTYEPLLRRLVKLKITYGFLRIHKFTDRMALAFADVYGCGNAKLFAGNAYYDQVSRTGRPAPATGNKYLAAEPQFEECELGTSYGDLRKLVVRTVTNSVSKSSESLSLSFGGKAEPVRAKVTSPLSAVVEEEGSTTIRGGGSHMMKARLETGLPQWTTPGWLDDRLEVVGFCPAITVHNANTLNEMMAADENIKLSVVDLTIYARSKPFDHGAVRLASYARTAASDSNFVIKSFLSDGKGRAVVAEGMRIQAMCKAFALEFNGLLKIEPPLDFLVTSCLQRKSKSSPGKENECLSLEPFLEGEYVKYNNNAFWVNESNDTFNLMAQAFSHFTFDRSWGHFLVGDLQGVGHLLTDPNIHTRDAERFKLTTTNFNEEGFKSFFAVHKCNSFCEQLGLKSNREMFISGVWQFREKWPKLEPTVCCSNKLCRNIIRLSKAHDSEEYPDHHWCAACYAQLVARPLKWICIEEGPSHEFEVSRFFYESQGQVTPKKCPAHREKDPTESSAAVVGGGLWSKMKSTGSKGSISGKVW